MIPLQVDLRNLIRALQSAAHAQNVTVRLIKRDRKTFLSFAISKVFGALGLSNPFLDKCVVSL